MQYLGVSLGRFVLYKAAVCAKPRIPVLWPPPRRRGDGPHTPPGAGAPGVPLGGLSGEILSKPVLKCVDLFSCSFSFEQMKRKKFCPQTKKRKIKTNFRISGKEIYLAAKFC